MASWDVVHSERRHLESTCCPTCGQALPATPVRVDVVACVAVANGRSISLRPMEADCLGALAAVMPRVATRDYLMEWIDFQSDPETDLCIKVLICRLRPKIAPIGLIIETVWGSGYRLAAETAPAMATLGRVPT